MWFESESSMAILFQTFSEVQSWMVLVTRQISPVLFVFRVACGRVCSGGSAREQYRDAVL
jgi:hypothetical protein